MEYYYTKLLATAAAAVEQKFEGSQHNIGENYWFAGLSLYAMEYRFPKNPHNVGLEVPIVDDLVEYFPSAWVYKTGRILEVKEGHGQKIYIIDSYYNKSAPYICQHQIIRIIERNINGKPCAYPAWDKEEV